MQLESIGIFKCADWLNNSINNSPFKQMHFLFWCENFSYYFLFKWKFLMTNIDMHLRLCRVLCALTNLVICWWRFLRLSKNQKLYDNVTNVDLYIFLNFHIISFLCLGLKWLYLNSFFSLINIKDKSLQIM